MIMVFTSKHNNFRLIKAMAAQETEEKKDQRALQRKMNVRNFAQNNNKQTLTVICFYGFRVNFYCSYPFLFFICFTFIFAKLL